MVFLLVVVPSGCWQAAHPQVHFAWQSFGHYRFCRTDLFVADIRSAVPNATWVGLAHLPCWKANAKNPLIRYESGLAVAAREIRQRFRLLQQCSRPPRQASRSGNHLRTSICMSSEMFEEQSYTAEHTKQGKRSLAGPNSVSGVKTFRRTNKLLVAEHPAGRRLFFYSGDAPLSRENPDYFWRLDLPSAFLWAILGPLSLMCAIRPPASGVTFVGIFRSCV